ncbi:MAG: MBL fold metallo-hydrolase [Candidatus Omnitrophota bacterium]
MTIHWLGHACFLITSEAGVKVLIDPFDASVGYKVPAVEVDVVLTTHDHSDHNAINVVKGQPQIIRGSGQHQAKGIDFTGVSSFHDTTAGSMRGRNTIFVFELDGIRICHLGDLGHILEHKQVGHIGPVDVLLIPVGGVFTINASDADKVIEHLRPRIVIPMHYKTPAISLPIEPVDRFLANKPTVWKPESSELTITSEQLPTETTVVILKYN